MSLHPPTNVWQHTVAILIGGQSTRMGEPKHELQLPNGDTMAEAMVNFATATAASTIIVGCVIDGHTCILDNRALRGPVAGIEALLDSGIDSEYLVVGCDMPAITPKDVCHLLEIEGNVIFTCGDLLLGLPLKLTTEALVACTDYLDRGNTSIKGFISEIPHTCVQIHDEKFELLQSINTPEQFNDFTLK